MLKPIFNQFVVTEMEQTVNNKTIILMKKSHPIQQGKVVSVSDGYFEKDDSVTKIPLPVKEGDIVIFPKGAGVNFEEEKQKYILLMKEHVLAVVTE